MNIDTSKPHPSTGSGLAANPDLPADCKAIAAAALAGQPQQPEKPGFEAVA